MDEALAPRRYGADVEKRLGERVRPPPGPPLVQIEDATGVARTRRKKGVGHVGEHLSEFIEVSREFIEHVGTARLTARATNQRASSVVGGGADASHEAPWRTVSLEVVGEEAAQIKDVVSELAKPLEPRAAVRLEGLGEQKRQGPIQRVPPYGFGSSVVR